MTRYDWDSIRRFYEAGHTLRETQARFGFSNGGWAAAVARGDVRPRPGRPPGRNGETRARVVELLNVGFSKAEVARRLGVTKSTVSRHAALAGLERDERCARRYDWAAIQRYYDEGHSITECQERFGFARKTAVDAVARGDFVTRPRAMPPEELFVEGTPRNNGHLRSRMYRLGLREPTCTDCGLSEWRGRPLTLQLHHINGNRNDHRLENLALLCPNCHTQTSNWGGRNVKRKAA